MALSGRAIRADECPLLGVKRTGRERAVMSANDVADIAGLNRQVSPGLRTGKIGRSW